MKTSRNILSALIAAGAPGVAVLALTNLIPADVALGIIATVGIAAFAVFDYSRSATPLRVPAELLRPTLPSPVAPRLAPAARRAA